MLFVSNIERCLWLGVERSVNCKEYRKVLMIDILMSDILPRLLRRSKKCRGHYSSLYHTTSRRFHIFDVTLPYLVYLVLACLKSVNL